MVVPQAIQSQLKKEALYGCAVCGCPVLEFIDFNPAKVEESTRQEVFLPESMLAICPLHNKKFQSGEIDHTLLASNKGKPFNKIHDDLAFATTLSNEFIISLGGCSFVNTSRLLAIDDFDLINVRRIDRRFLVMDVNFFNVNNQLVGILLENSWSSEPSSGEWAIEYLQPKRLIIRNKRENMFFEAVFENSNMLRILADGLFYNSQKIQITQNEILLDGREIGTDIKGTVLTNYDIGISTQSVTF
ncbi:MAG TPA: hypothetical protein VE130_01570 [Nitrososphaeraceae archaeon]|nr:hypothetical protein [Nitrososphaeraceae archaeon]